MLQYVFECSTCTHGRKHIHPELSFLESYKDHCTSCEGIQDFSFVSTEKISLDVFRNVTSEQLIMRDESLLSKERGKNFKVAS